MDNHAPPEPDARARLTHDQAQELVLRIVSTQAESLLRTAYRNSLCSDDAHDAYQRSMEIFLRRAHTLDPRSAHKWIHVVVKREAQALRRARSGSVPYEAVDFELHAASEVSTPEERVLAKERARRAAEALRRLKPQERRAMGLKAFGHSYAEIAEVTGFSGTKINRCLTEGRKSFLERFEGIEAGVECQRWRPVLSAMVSGEATAAQITEARPHLRNCPACKATLRALHQSRRPLKAVLPVGLVSLGTKLSGLLERVLPGVGGGDAGGVASGGAGLLGVGGAKLAGLLAAGAVATAGGGLVGAHDGNGRRSSPARAVRAAPARGAVSVASPRRVSTAPARAAPATVALRRRGRSQRVAVSGSAKRRIEFAPRGSDLTPTPTARTTPKAVRAVAPRPVISGSDSTRGEFAPQP
jgi:RNA polymerase sigma factor (sigma-70 family)